MLVTKKSGIILWRINSNQNISSSFLLFEYVFFNSLWSNSNLFLPIITACMTNVFIWKTNLHTVCCVCNILEKCASFSVSPFVYVCACFCTSYLLGTKNLLLLSKWGERAVWAHTYSLLSVDHFLNTARCQWTNWTRFLRLVSSSPGHLSVFHLLIDTRDCPELAHFVATTTYPWPSQDKEYNKELELGSGLELGLDGFLVVFWLGLG